VSSDVQILLILAIALLLAGSVSRVAAQQMPRQTPQTQPLQTQTQPGQALGQAPEQSYSEPQTQRSQQTPGAQPPQSQSVQTFMGTIVKSGDKYVLQDESSGKTYDIDHQRDVSKHVNRRVRVDGTLDPSGNMIHIQ
jgi:uncharacterized protein YdeI (BOF family)